METHRRGSDGRRVFTADFKREQIERVLRGDSTIARVLPPFHCALAGRWSRVSIPCEGGQRSCGQARHRVAL